MTLPWTAAAASPDLTFALQPPPPPPDQMPPVDTAAPPPADQPPAPPPASLGGLKIDGNGASLKLGILFQPSYEVASGSLASTQTVSHFFVRRMRLMAALTLGTQFEFFADTDAPNIGRNANVAPTAGMAMQDAFMTWKPMDEFKLDGGMMLIPFSHNSVQGATTLYAWDYFASSFNQSAGFGNFAGRDVGLQARGLVIGHLEYRLGVFTGSRPVPPAGASRAEMRIAARVQYNLFDPETAFFYAGTYGGTKKVVSLGAAVDHQDSYTAFGVDGFVDLPVGADVLTAQAAFLHYDAGTPGWIAVPKQNDVIVEAGYRLSALKISPIVRFEDQFFAAAAPGAASTSILRISAGLAWWPMGHNLNVKLFYTYVKPPTNPFNQLNLQVQLYVF
ncbi:MAG TPA: porin [Polyangia bacterium]|nr:porin [Polyangia bacterium]